MFKKMPLALLLISYYFELFSLSLSLTLSAISSCLKSFSAPTGYISSLSAVIGIAGYYLLHLVDT